MKTNNDGTAGLMNESNHGNKTHLEGKFVSKESESRGRLICSANPTYDQDRFFFTEAQEKRATANRILNPGAAASSDSGTGGEYGAIPS